MFLTFLFLRVRVSCIIYFNFINVYVVSSRKVSGDCGLFYFTTPPPFFVFLHFFLEKKQLEKKKWYTLFVHVDYSGHRETFQHTVN